MSRFRSLAAAVALGLAGGAIGCAHCSTCDDFPAPCVGGNCYGMAPAAVVAAAPAMGETGMLPSGPITSEPAAPSPFSPPTPAVP